MPKKEKLDEFDDAMTKMALWLNKIPAEARPVIADKLMDRLLLEMGSDESMESIDFLIRGQELGRS